MVKSFIVTGGAGFIGSVVCRNLVCLGYNVLAVDNLSSGSKSNIWELFEYPNFEFIEGDCSDKNLILKIIDEYDSIIHLAADVGVDKILSDPASAMMNNLKCSEIIISLAHKFHKRLFVASSSEVYGKQNIEKLSEEGKIELYSPEIYRWSYACTKATDEFLAMAFAKKGLNVIIGRFFNVIGERQLSTYGMVVPKFIQQSLNNEPITVYGNGMQSRCFCNVADTTNAIIRLVMSSVSGGIYNIGNTNSITIGELALKIKKKCKSNSEIIFINNDNLLPGFEEIEKRIPDNSKIKKDFGWEPKISLDESLDEVIDFEKKRLLYTGVKA